MMKRCTHVSAYTGCSPSAVRAGFARVPLDRRLAATTASGRRTKEKLATHEQAMTDGCSFPGPLVLPDDDLDLDPEYPPQSLKSWLSYNKKMPIIEERKVIYVVEPPQLADDVKTLMRGWEKPRVHKNFAMADLPEMIAPPSSCDVCGYLRAFYHGMDVKIHEGKFRWQAWDSESSEKGQNYIGLATPEPTQELIGVRYRQSPDGVARMQLNLNDVLDALIDRVPPDAYAIVMLTDYDLYEDEEDDFCCGRAYGESRIAVVSSFRYAPSLDLYSDIDLEHMWPASHCKSYVDSLCAASEEAPQGKLPAKTAQAVRPPADSPLAAAVEACKKVPRPKTRDELAGLWFSRVARTTSHELGHCLGMDHCVYYACAMQGTAGLAEDVRQPPYLCPVCLSKVSRGLHSSTAGTGAVVDQQREYIKRRYEALVEFCEDWKHVSMFAGYHAWVEKRLQEIEALGNQE